MSLHRIFLHILNEHGAVLGALQLDQRVQAAGALNDLQKVLGVEGNREGFQAPAIADCRNLALIPDLLGGFLARFLSLLNFQYGNVHSSSPSDEKRGDRISHVDPPDGLS